MADEKEYGDMEGWIEQEDTLCEKCEKPIDLPIWDGPYEKYTNPSLPEGRICNRCNRQLCEECAQWKKSEISFHQVCSECYDEELEELGEEKGE